MNRNHSFILLVVVALLAVASLAFRAAIATSATVSGGRAALLQQSHSLEERDERAKHNNAILDHFPGKEKDDLVGITSLGSVPPDPAGYFNLVSEASNGAALSASKIRSKIPSEFIQPVVSDDVGAASDELTEPMGARTLRAAIPAEFIQPVESSGYFDTVSSASPSAITGSAHPPELENPVQTSNLAGYWNTVTQDHTFK